MNKNNRTFINASVISICFFVLLVMTFIYLLKVSNLLIYNAIFLVLLAFTLISMITIILIIALIVTTNSLIKSPYHISNAGKRGFIIQKYLKINYWAVKNVLMPLLQLIVQIFSLDNEQLERFFIEFNNNIVKSMNVKYENTDVIMIFPHCLQNQACKFKITNDISNCKRCGSCDIGDIAALSEKWGITAIVVTGGTAARTVLAKTRPKAVISVACERDLASGIRDVRNIPVAGVLNTRPNGPCVNTKVDIKEIEKTIEQLVR